MSNTKILDEIDTNLKNYTPNDLMAIVGIQTLDNQEITQKTDQEIQKWRAKNKPDLANFFQEIQNNLLQYSNDLQTPTDAIYKPAEYQTLNWIQNEVLEQDDKNQTTKITDRKQKIDVFGNQHMPMNRQQLGINNNYNVPVVQDKLNPNLKNVYNRFINLDSQFRQYSNGFESTTNDYTLTLSDTLSNVLNIRLFSYQIPYSWYIIDKVYGNTCFWIIDIDTDTVVNISIEPGNYTASTLIIELTSTLIDAGFTFSTITPITYNSSNGKITFNIYAGIYISPIDESTFTITETTQILFYDFTGKLQCSTQCINKSFYLNQTLGWIMGFRDPYISVIATGNIGNAVVDLNGTKYLILVVEDYNQNHINNGMVSITDNQTKLKLPSYYSPDIPSYCLKPEISNLQSLITDEAIIGKSGNGLLIGGKYEYDYTTTQIVLPSAPRTLTQTQIYTINEINKNRNNNTNFLAKAPTSPDILSIIPIKTNGISTGTIIVDLAGSLQDNTRTYFGPVNIERMAIRLLDDKGNLLNLNGSDWCITLIAECLYQY